MKLRCRCHLSNLLSRLASSTPMMLRKGNPEVDPTRLSMWLGKELAAELLSVLNLIRLELVPKHSDDIALINAFWDELICEVAAYPQMYFERPDSVAGLVDQFGDRWKKPLSEFEVIYAINFLAIGQEPISVLEVEFLPPTAEVMAQRAIPRVEDWVWSNEESHLTMAFARVEAADSTLAFEAGKGRVIDAISLMRVSALRGLAGVTADDEFLQWKLSGHHLVRPVTAEGESEWSIRGYHRQFGPLVDELGSYVRRGIEGLRLELFSALQDDIRERVLRSIHWIEHSTTHEADDHKIVDLCTALEILLLPEGQSVRNKGTVIALRYNLLGGDLNPLAVRWMYNLRNKVVHGNPLPVVVPQERWELRLVCLTTVRLLMLASAAHPSVSTLQGLIGTVETEGRLKAFIELAQKGVYGDKDNNLLRQLLGEAKRRLRS